MNFKSKKIINWFLLIFWTGLIFYLSNKPFLSSGLAIEEDFILRKIAHIGEYAILTFLAWRVLDGLSLGNGVSKLLLSRNLIYAAIFSVIYAISDEVHQLFVVGRAGKVEDVVIDSIGIFIATAIIWRGKLNK